MPKISLYFPLSILIILAIGGTFYFLTAEEVIFFGGKKNATPQSILPNANVKVLEEVRSVIPVQKPKPVQKQLEVQPKTSTPAPEEAVKTHIISVESDGFKPRIVVINAGDVVKWVNNDSRLHWPASDPHPTHTGLSGFDPLADISSEESYFFTFNQVGVFGYHDHTQAIVGGVATLTGIVRVLEK